MEYRVDKKGGGISVLGMGCMRFPKNVGAIDMQKTEELILSAVDSGVNYFDTAYIYGGSEEALGKILTKNNIRGKVNIATKLPLVYLKSPSDFDKFFDRQLERLQTDYIDYYLMHMLTDMEIWEKLCGWGIEEWIQQKKESSKIRQIGFSFHGKQQEFMRLLDAYDWDFCQIQYNYLNENYQAGTAGLKKANEKGLPVIIMEPLLGGKLATGLPQKAVDVFKSADSNLTPAAWGLRWLWNQKQVTCILSGMSDMAQLSENVRTADGVFPDMLTAAEINAVEEVVKIVNSSYKVPCTGCGYCMPCPKNVNIPACFHAYNTSFSLGKRAGMQHYLTGVGITSDSLASAGMCIKCGKCVSHCPQSISIPDELDNVKKRLEPLWMRTGIKLARAFLSKK